MFFNDETRQCTGGGQRIKCEYCEGDDDNKSRFVHEIGEHYAEIGVVKFYNDGVVQAVTFAYLIYW